MFPPNKTSGCGEPIFVLSAEVIPATPSVSFMITSPVAVLIPSVLYP